MRAGLRRRLLVSGNVKYRDEHDKFSRHGRDKFSRDVHDKFISVGHDWQTYGLIALQGET